MSFVKHRWHDWDVLHARQREVILGADGIALSEPIEAISFDQFRGPNAVNGKFNFLPAHVLSFFFRQYRPRPSAVQRLHIRLHGPEIFKLMQHLHLPLVLQLT
jgi:hypothetical protein